MVIEPKFDSVTFFRCGLASVQYKGKFGFISPDGSWQIKPRFVSATEFQCYDTQVPIALVKNRKGKEVVISNKGTTKQGKRFKYVSFINYGCNATLPAEPYSHFYKGPNGFDQIYHYDVITSGNQKLAMCDTFSTRLDTIIAYGNQSILVKKDNRFGFYRVRYPRLVRTTDYLNNQIPEQVVKYPQINLMYDEVIYTRQSENVEVSYAIARIGNLYGILNAYGDKITEIKYHSIKYLKDSLALVEFKPGHFGFYDLDKRVEYFQSH